MKKLIRCFTEALGVPESAVTDSLAYQSVAQWDSIGHMALVAAIESTFGVMLDTDEIVGMSTVAKAKEILKKHGVAL